MIKHAVLTLLLIAIGPIHATERPVQAPVPDYEVRRAKAEIVIDGHLDDSAWRNAASIDLQFPWNQQTGSQQATRARLLWDDAYLYVAYECEDIDITARHTHHDDPTYEDDAVELFIDTGSDKPGYIGLEMNALGVLYDYFKSTRGLDKSYDLKGVRIAVQRQGTLNDASDQDKRWVLELAIPLSNFSQPAMVGTVWKANLNRWDGTAPHRRLSMWSDSGKLQPDPHQPERFGRLHFSGDMQTYAK
ncbi:carbohydrate-binding family 9-like protein [Duganella sp. PWIR1]